MSWFTTEGGRLGGTNIEAAGRERPKRSSADWQIKRPALHTRSFASEMESTCTESILDASRSGFSKSSGAIAKPRRTHSCRALKLSEKTERSSRLILIAVE